MNRYPPPDTFIPDDPLQDIEGWILAYIRGVRFDTALARTLDGSAYLNGSRHGRLDMLRHELRRLVNLLRAVRYHKSKGGSQ